MQVKSSSRGEIQRRKEFEMKHLFTSMMLAVLMLSCFPSGDAVLGVRGTLMVAGGGLDSENEALFAEFIEAAGGPIKARIAILPLGSGNPSQSGAFYKYIFEKYGVPREHIWVVPIAQLDDKESPQLDESNWKYSGLQTRDEIISIYMDQMRKNMPDAHDRKIRRAAVQFMKEQNILGADEISEKLKGYTGFWFTGGWQGRVRDLLLEENSGRYRDGEVMSVLREELLNGAAIGGTSAGAAIMSDPMIDGGTSLGAVLQGSTNEDPYYDDSDERVYLTKGLGFWADGITDQHFIRRGRFGRLIAALFESGKSIGLGIDENTSFSIKGPMVEVFGETGMVVIDISTAKLISQSPLVAEGIKLHYLEEKDLFNYKTGEVILAKYKTNSLTGDESSSVPPKVNGNVFANNEIINHLIYELVENTAQENFGFAFVSDDSLKNVEPGSAAYFRFYKQSDTEGFWGRKVFSGRAHYSVINAYLDISTASVSIEGGE
jgi:cyanophycinase